MKRVAVFLLALLSSRAFAAITQVGSATDDRSASGTSATLTAPTGTTTDDYVYVVCNIPTTDGTWTDPTGFVEIYQATSASGNPDTNIYAGYYKVTASPPTYTFSNSGTADTVRCVMSAWRGVDSTTALDVTFVSGSHVNEALNTPLLAPPAITTTTNGAMVIATQVSSFNDATGGASSGFTLNGEFDANAPQMYQQYFEDVAFGTVTPGDWTHTGTNVNADPRNIIIAFKPAAGATPISFSSGPTVSAATNGYTISGTLTDIDGTATVYSAAWPPAASAPADCAAVAAASGALFAASDATWAEDVGDSFALTEANNPPRTDVYTCVTDDSNSTTPVAAADSDRSADASQTIVALTSVASTSPFAVHSDTTCDTDGSTAVLTGCASAFTSKLQAGMLIDVSAGFADLTDRIVEAVDTTTITLDEASTSMQTNITTTLDLYYSATVAAGDVVEYDSATSGTDAVTIGVDGDVSYTDTTGGAHTTLDYCIEDVSDATDATFTTPSCWTTDDKLYFFNSRPSWQDLGLFPLILDYNTAMTAINLDSNCTDGDGDALTYAVESGTVPTGTTISAGGDWTGTPTVEDETGVTLRIRCTDAGGLVVESGDLDTYVVGTVTMPTLDDSDTTDALSDYASSFPWASGLGFELGITTTCGIEAVGQVLSQSPAASTEVAYDAAVSIVVSNGSTCSGARRRTFRMPAPGVAF